MLPLLPWHCKKEFVLYLCCFVFVFPPGRSTTGKCCFYFLCVFLFGRRARLSIWWWIKAAVPRLSPSLMVLTLCLSLMSISLSYVRDHLLYFVWLAAYILSLFDYHGRCATCLYLTLMSLSSRCHYKLLFLVSRAQSSCSLLQNIDVNQLLLRCISEGNAAPMHLLNSCSYFALHGTSGVFDQPGWSDLCSREQQIHFEIF